MSSKKDKQSKIIQSFIDHADDWQEWCECAGLEYNEDNSIDQIENVLRNGLNDGDVRAIYDALQTNGII